MIITNSDKANQTNVIEKTLVILLLFLFVAFTFLYSTVFTWKGSALLGILSITIISLILQLGVMQPLENLRKEFRKCSQLTTEQNKSAKLLIRRDLELSKANEKLQEIDRVKSSFISVVAHQLRTPLSGIKWTLNMILSEDLGKLNHEQKDFLQKTYESNDRMINLVNDMLGADRLQSGKLRFEFKNASIHGIIDQMVFELTPAAAKKHVQFEYKNDIKRLPQVLIDTEKIRGVIQNLLENAIKYTMNGGKVSIGGEVVGDKLKVSISDTGIGIPENEQQKIFTRFFRATNASKAETDGSGLGLFIAQGIIERHNGTIGFESKEGKGTTFYFTVPLYQPSAMPISSFPRIDSPAKLTS